MRELLLALALAIGLGTSLDTAMSAESLLGQSAEVATALSKLGDEPRYILPKDLGELVQTADAGVVARLSSLGELKFVSDVSPQGVTIAVDAFAEYRVAILDVLYNDLKSAAPPLRAGTEVTLSKKVGRTEAEAFYAKQAPVKAGDECLLFLWHRPGFKEWSVLQWPLQFRRSIPVPDGVEEVAPVPNGRTFLSAEWLGPAVPAVVSGNGRSWSALVGEVRRLGSTVKR